MVLQDKLVELTGIVVVSQPLSQARGEDETTLDIRGYRQTSTFSCGFVAGLSVVHTFHPRANITKFYHTCNPKEDEGTSTGKLVKALRKFKVGVSIKAKMRFCEIVKTIEKGTPIITTIKKDGIEHWVVIYGYGVNPNRVFVAGNNFPYSLFRTALRWGDFRKLLPMEQVWLVCSGKAPLESSSQISLIRAQVAWVS